MSNLHPKSPQVMLSLLDDGYLTPEESVTYLQFMQSNTSHSSDQDETLEVIQNELREAASQPHTWNDVSPQFRSDVIAKIRLASSESTAVDPHRRLEDQIFLSPPQGPGEIGRLGVYRILRKMGEGGMGVVFEAQDTHLERRVAIKTMHPKLADDLDCRERFLKEARAAARVEHDFICPIYQVGEQNGIPFLAMPFLIGETLESAMRHNPLPLRVAIRIAMEIARGLEAAHSANLVHRDIKPSNIWLEQRPDGETPRVKILDFGLARNVSEDSRLSQAGAIMGTPSYMSPEQARGQPVDTRSDLYSLGTVLYEMLTQKRPFTGHNPLSVMTNLILEQPKAPIEIDNSIPAALSELVMALLSKSPNDRPQTAKLVAEKLQFIDEQLPRNASSAGAVQAVRPSTKSNRFRSVIVPAIALGLLGFLGSLAGVLIFQDRNGTLEIVYEGEADLRLHDGGIQIFDSNNQLKYTLSPSERNRSLPPGSYRVKVIGTDGVKLETESFEMAQAGVFTLRATAKPADPVENNLHDEKRETPVHLDQAFFPGRVVVWENFTDADRCSIPISANQKVEDHRFIAMKSDCMVNALLPLDLGPNLETGAGFIRCRGVNSRVFFNFATRQTQDQFRWLGVNNPKPVLWCINIHRQDLENGLWTAKPSTRVSESFIEVADSAPGKWLEFAFRWSPRTYDVWLNNRYLGGGELPSEELTIGKPKAMQLAAIAATAGNIQLEIDSLGIWDQSDLMGGDELPATLTRDTK